MKAIILRYDIKKQEVSAIDAFTFTFTFYIFYSFH
jgi:hypothetical protein